MRLREKEGWREVEARESGRNRVRSEGGREGGR